MRHLVGVDEDDGCCCRGVVGVANDVTSHEREGLVLHFLCEVVELLV